MASQNKFLMFEKNSLVTSIFYKLAGQVKYSLLIGLNLFGLSTAIGATSSHHSIHHTSSKPTVMPVKQAIIDAPSVNDLITVFNQALVSDPNFQAQKATLLSQQENVPIARSYLLPNIGLGGQSEFNHLNQRTSGLPSPGDISFGAAGTYKYTSNQYGVYLTQPIFNFGAWSGFKETKASVKAATSTFVSHYQELMIDVSRRYFNILQAKDILNYTEVEKIAVERLYYQQLQRYKVGIDTLTDVYNAKADLDQIISQEIAAKNNLNNSQESLRAITGELYSSLAGLGKNVPLINPTPNNRQDWADTALKQNLAVQAARYATEAARENIHVQVSGALPSINAIASYQEIHNSDNGFGETNQGVAAAGASLTLPLFQGGLVASQTKQAQYDYQTSLANLEQTIRTSSENARQSFNSVTSDVSKLTADKQAIISNTRSLESNEAAFNVGTRTIIDVLNAQTNLFQTQVTYTQDLYAYILDTLLLKQAAGTLKITDLEAINQWLTQNTNLQIYSTPYNPPPTVVPNKQLSSTELEQAAHKFQGKLPLFNSQPNTQWTTPAPQASVSPTPNPGVSTNPSASYIPASNTTDQATTAVINPTVVAKTGAT